MIDFREEPNPIKAGVNIRPGTLECLKKAGKHFQVIVFTASEKEYADAILDLIDPDYKLIQARYYRDSCV